MSKDPMPNAKRLMAFLSATVLTGCMFAPGMQMQTAHLTPSINAENEVVTPKIISITAELIQQQQKEAADELARTIHEYAPPETFSASSERYRYLVGPQDVLRIIVWDHPNLTNPTNAKDTTTGITVEHDGHIFYPYVGKLKVQGLSTGQIRSVLTEKLSKFIQNPQLSVDVIGFNSQKIHVTGAVKEPRIIPVTNVPTTVLEAITSAGGPLRCGVASQTQNAGVSPLCADMKNVVVSRRGKTSKVDVDTLTAVDGTSLNWVLTDSDVVYVPNNNDYRVFVLGAVNNPGPYNMSDGRMSLKEALGNAKGVTYSANPKYTYVIRNYAKIPRIFSLNARSPDALNLAGEFALMPEDVVFVTSAKLQTFNDLLSQINPTLITAVNAKVLLK